MSWDDLFGKKKEDGVPNPEAGAGDGKGPEKTPAELIAESLSTALKPMTDSMAALTAKVEGIEKGVVRPSKTENQPPPERVSVFDDEETAFGQRMAPLMIRQLAFEATVALDRVKQEYVGAGYGDAWGQFEKDIKATLENAALVDGAGNTLRGNEQYIRNVVNMIFGAAAMKAGVKFGGKDRGFFLESAGGNTEAVGGGSSVGDGLTEGQRKVFTRTGVDPKEASKVMARLKFVN